MPRALPMVAAVLLSASTAFAQPDEEATSGDPRVRSQLDAAGLHYSLTSLNNFELIWDLEDERSHVVFINSHTSTWSDVEIRRVYSTAWASSTPPSAELANRLLLDNSEFTVGAWEMSLIDDEYFVQFVVRVPATADAEVLDTAIAAARIEGDALEKEMSETDEF